MTGRNTLSLAVERRRIPARSMQGAIVLAKLPLPPSLNNLFEIERGKGQLQSRAYREWVQIASRLVAAQRPQRIRGPVAVTLTFERGRTRIDIDNLAKAPLDLLVALGLIEASDAHIVRRVVLQWGAVEGMQVNVQSSREGAGNG